MLNLKRHKQGTNLLFLLVQAALLPHIGCVQHPLLAIFHAVCPGTSNTPQKSMLPSNNLNFKQPIGLEKLVLGLMQLQVVFQDLTHGKL